MRARIVEHPIHPMLVPIPIGLFVFSLAADIAYRSGAGPVWSEMAFWTMVGGLVGAILAAVPGLIDYLSLTDRRAVRTATIHMVLNLTVVGLFVASLIGRLRRPPETTWPFALSVVGVALLCVSGWLGGTLVYEEGVAVNPAIEIRNRRADKGHAA